MHRYLLIPLVAVICAMAAFVPGTACATTISVVDDAGHTVKLSSPARRIVSLAPHATELLFAAGAGARIVGVSEYSNYPAEASKIQSIGNTFALDLERIVALKPDLIVMWGSGNSAGQGAKLHTLGIPIFESEPRDYETVATSLERLSRLAGTEKSGTAAANAFRLRRDRIAGMYRQRERVTVFYQIWRDPLMTLNDEHMVSGAIRLCGGDNLFGKLPTLTPTVDVEAVVKADPEVIISGSSSKNDEMAMWKDFPKMSAVARGNLFTINSDLLTRAGPRILDGTEALCRDLDEARRKRK